MNDHSFNVTLLALQILSAFFILVSGMLSKYGRYSFPFLIAMVYLGWYLPQVYALTLLPSVNGLTSLQTMSFLSLAACVAGWYLPLKSVSSPINVHRQFNLRRLYIATWLVTAFAVLMNLLVEMTPDNQKVTASGWTGPLTIYAFFASVSVVGLSCSFYLFLQKQRAPQVCLLAVNIALFLPAVFLSFRRAQLLEFGFVIILGLLTLRKQFLVSKWAVIAGVVFGFFFVQGVGTLRSLSGGYRLNAQGKIETKLISMDDLRGISWSEIFDNSFRETQTESGNAAYYFYYASEEPPRLGANLWNVLVFSYFPAQIFGAENKNGLMISGPRDAGSNTPLELGAIGHQLLEKFPGQTDTGFIDPYSDFGYLGALVFLLVASALRRQFERLTRNRDAVAYVIYSSLLAYALHSVTHTGYYLLVHSPLLLATIGAIFFFSREKDVAHRAQTRPRPYTKSPRG